MTSNHRLEYTAGLALATTSLHALGIVFALLMQRAAVRPFIRPACGAFATAVVGFSVGQL